VWWCRACWRVFRVKQNEEKRKHRQATLEQHLFAPRSSGWSKTSYRSKGGMAALSPSDQVLVRGELNRLIEDCKREGRPLTPLKIRSLTANAIFIVKYVRTGKVLGWMGNYRKRRKQWERFQENQQAEQSGAKLNRQRFKVLDIG
jgi:hypothetical protein